MILSLFGLIMMCLSTILMLAILFWGRNYVLKQKFTSSILVNLIFFFSIYKVLAYYFLPLLMGLLSGFKYADEDGIELIELGQLYFIEFISWVTWLFGLILISKNLKIKGKKNENLDLNKSNKFSKIILILLSTSYFPIAIFSNLSNFELQGDLTLPIWIEVYKSLINYAGPAASLLLIILSLRGWGWLYGAVGFIGAISFFAILSSRGAFVYSILFYSFIYYETSVQKKIDLIKIGAISISCIVFYIIMGGIPSLSIDNESMRIQVIVDLEKKGSKSALEEIEWRFGTPARLSTTFIRMYDRGDGAGLKPIINSFFGFIPRSINPEKPIPSTVDGSDIFTQGMYYIYREVYGYNTASMSEFSSGGHAYWELGWLGVIILPFVSGIYIGLCAFYFQKLGICSLALMMSVFKPFGYVDPKIWVSDIVMQFYQIILPLLLFIILYRLFIMANKFKLGRFKN